MSVVKSITSPMKFLIQASLLADLGKHIEQYGKKALIIADPFIHEKARKDSAGCFEECGIQAVFSVFGGECSDDEINKNQALFTENACEYVVGIGGGHVDVVQHNHGGAVVAVRQFAQQLHELAGGIHIQIIERLDRRAVYGFDGDL